jgi:hypothetical protein
VTRRYLFVTAEGYEEYSREQREQQVAKAMAEPSVEDFC